MDVGATDTTTTKVSTRDPSYIHMVLCIHVIFKHIRLSHCQRIPHPLQDEPTIEEEEEVPVAESSQRVEVKMEQFDDSTQ